VLVVARACAALLATIGAAFTVGGAAARGDSELQQRQLCVDRWSALNMRWGEANTIAVVRAMPCRVTLAYAFPGRRSQAQLRVRRQPIRRLFVSQPRTGAGLRRRRLERDLRGYVLRSEHPPARRLPFTPPSWVKRHEVTNGYIIPFDRRGAQVAGIRVVAAVTGSCLKQGGRLTFRSGLRCFGDDDYIRDPCFTATGRVQQGDSALCPRAPGSTAFDRLRIKSVS
jgi:hypothetical protein